MLPSVGFKSPEMQPIDVDLPAPLGPKSPKILPGWAVNETPSTASKSP